MMYKKIVLYLFLFVFFPNICFAKNLVVNEIKKCEEESNNFYKIFKYICSKKDIKNIEKNTGIKYTENITKDNIHIIKNNIEGNNVCNEDKDGEKIKFATEYMCIIGLKGVETETKITKNNIPVVCTQTIGAIFDSYKIKFENKYEKEVNLINTLNKYPDSSYLLAKGFYKTIDDKLLDEPKYKDALRIKCIESLNLTIKQPKF